MDMLLFSLNRDTNTPLYEQLYEGIKDAIIQQKIAVGEKLPSKRKLSDFLNISQTTIELAYAQLLAEGYIASKPRVGYFVEDIDELPFIEKPISSTASNYKKRTYKIDFSPGKIDEDSFPFTVWRKYAKELIDSHSKELLQIGDRQGECELRTQIASYLYQSRGINCTAEQIVIGSGTEQLMPFILRLFDDANIALENPGYSAIPRNQFEHVVIPVDVDSDGLQIDQLEKTEANLVYITPSHQFPTGAVLSAARRAQLLKWAAQKVSRYIIEDDYDSEFRYIGKPIPALHSLDQNDKVIYISTFTKSLMPSLRVAYFVLPPTLLARYNEIFGYYSATVPRFDQHILAHFMKDGHFSKHLNRMRKIYRKKHDKLLTILTKHYPTIKVSGDVAGMHVLIQVPHEKQEHELQQIALENDISILPISNYLLAPIQLKLPTFLLGFGGIPIEKIESYVDALMAAWGISKH
ncbi:MocR-like pyridoxine biosynthesis transcription factor PdxR [Bacillus ndiopicus]|uniref:MocR-like pyridoxine biosynthesis transcription factor PdxR n=1 Tax=Bacillus ndiopicus TaxID=1347368 RepID=UPI000A6B39E7|nr:PLP-dependent aminotransferase family protein [Bacillus ndiopicus]